MKWIITVGFAALVAATVIVATAAGTSKKLELAVDGRHATRSMVDAAPLHTPKAPNDTPGDTIVLHAPLLDRNGKNVGRLDATFLTTAPGTSKVHDGSEQLTGTLTFTDGSELAVQGVVGAYATISHVAVVGGTGRYAGARGQVTARFSPRAVSLSVALS